MSYQQSEARAWFLEAMVLPAQGLESIRDELIESGGRIGGPLLSDPLFVHADLPAGWRIDCTDRPSTSLIVDDAGRVRAEVFYRVDNVERVATIRREPQYVIRIDLLRVLRHESVAVVFDGGLPIHETAPIEYSPSNSADRYFADEMSLLAARRFLDQHCPEWRGREHVRDFRKTSLLIGNPCRG